MLPPQCARFPKNSKIQTLESLHNDRVLYIADSNMIHHYVHDTIPAWSKVVNNVISKGNSIYVTPRCATLAGIGKIPSNFVVIPTSMDKDMNTESAFKGFQKLTRKTDWSTKDYTIVEEDIKVLLEVGWYATQIPIPFEELRAKEKIVFITNNMDLSHGILSVKGYLEKLETCVNVFGLEHLVHLIWVCEREGNVAQFCDSAFE